MGAMRRRAGAFAAAGAETDEAALVARPPPSRVAILRGEIWSSTARFGRGASVWNRPSCRLPTATRHRPTA